MLDPMLCGDSVWHLHVPWITTSEQLIHASCLLSDFARQVSHFCAASRWQPLSPSFSSFPQKYGSRFGSYAYRAGSWTLIYLTCTQLILRTFRTKMTTTYSN